MSRDVLQRLSLTNFPQLLTNYLETNRVLEHSALKYIKSLNNKGGGSGRRNSV
jgi:hypothetical protein